MRYERTYMSGAENSAGPIAHEYIIAVLETIRTRALAEPLLSFLELFEEPEIARNYDQ